MADLERIKKKYDTPEIEIEEATNGGNRYSLPYGLCKSVGINTEGMTPREAWEAWQNKTGKTKEEAEKEHWGKEASEKNEKKSPAIGEKNKENELNATDEQRKIIDKFSERLAVGKNGTMRYGGDQATIVEAPTFSRLENGDIEYRVVGVREIPAQKSDVIGVGDTKAKTRTTISTGIIKQDGLIINNRNEVTEETGLKTPDKQPQQEKETPVNANQEATSALVQKTEEQTAVKNSPAHEATNAGRAYSSTRKGVSEDLARRAQESRSFSEYKSGSATASYNSDVSRFDSNVNELIQRYGKNSTLTDKDWEDVYSIADRYAQSLEKYTDETNRNEASYPSWFISGPARYNTKKNEALMNRSQALYENYKDRVDPDNNVYLKKIKAILTNASIKSNDDAATAKLQDKYDKLKAELENGKAMNAYFRKYGTIKGFPGVSDKTAQEFLEAREREPYFNKQPYAAYHMTNVNAELRRIQARIDTLNKAKSQAEAAKANPQAAAEATAANYPKLDGVKVQENADEMRIQLRFDDIPPAETREKLKRNGFRWSPAQKAWQRLLNENGKYAAKMVLKDLGGK